MLRRTFLFCVVVAAISASAAVVHSPAGDLTVRELTLADRKLQANTLYYVRTNMTIVGATSTSASAPGESGLTVPSGTTYLYVPAGVELKVRGGNGCPATPGSQGCQPTTDDLTTYRPPNFEINLPKLSFYTADKSKSYGTAASGGGAGIDLSSGGTLVAIGAGSITAEGGAGGKGAAGGQSASGQYFSYPAATYTQGAWNTNPENGGWTGVCQTDLPTSSWSVFIDNIQTQRTAKAAYSVYNENFRMEPASGASGGGGAGGGGAGIGMPGGSGSNGAFGGNRTTNWYTSRESGVTAADGASAVDPASLGLPTGCFLVNPALHVLAAGGAGGLSDKSDSDVVERREITLQTYTNNNQKIEVVSQGVVLWLEAGQRGGGGGAGGKGAAVGCGGTGGFGGDGGSSGSAIDSYYAKAEGYTNSAKLGKNGKDGAVGLACPSSTNVLEDANLPFNRAVYANLPSGAVTQMWHFASASTLTAPPCPEFGMLGWKVVEPSVILPGMTTNSTAFLNGDATWYWPNDAVKLDASLYGDTRLESQILKVGTSDLKLSLTRPYYEAIRKDQGTLDGIKQYMNQACPNGHARWQNYVLNLSMTTNVSGVRVGLAFERLTGVTNAVVKSLMTPKSSGETGILPKYTFWKTNALPKVSAEWTKAAGPQNESEFRSPVSDASDFYKMCVDFVQEAWEQK